MPEKAPVGRGAFIGSGRQAARDEEIATDLAQAAGVQKVDDPRTGAVFLSLVNRLSTLEAAVRGERLRRVGAEEQQEVLVLDNEEAQEKIKELQAEIAALIAAQGTEASDAAIELAKVQGDLNLLLEAALAVVQNFRANNIATELAALPPGPPNFFNVFHSSLIALESRVGRT